MTRFRIPAFLCSSLLLISCWIMIHSRASGEDPKGDQNTGFMMSTVRAYSVRETSPDGRSLSLSPRPLLKWTNPVSGIEHGLLVAWTVENRPAVFAQVFKLPEPLRFWLHECQSVSSKPLEMTLSSQSVWSPQAASGGFRPLPEGDAPASKRPALIAQAKSLARRFSATEDFRTTPSSPVEKFELRLIPQPVHQYASEKLGVRSAAVFAFVNGTDPEVLLVLEARDPESGAATTSVKSPAATTSQGTWHYLLCPMTCWGTAVRFDGQEVWQVEEQFGKTGRTDPYFTWRVDSTLVAKDPMEN